MAEKGYIRRVIKNASFEKLSYTINAAHERSGKSKLSIFLDMCWCLARYGAGYYDYLIFRFYDLTPAQRKTYVTRFISKNFNMFMNDVNYCDLFDNKDEFYERFAEFTGRSFLDLSKATVEDVAKFCEGKERIFCKPRSKTCGIGCMRLNVADFATPEALFEHLKANDIYTIEDVIVNHPDVRKLYDNAVNSMRIITLLDANKEVHILYMVQKIGLNGSIIDNNCMFSPVDPETGKIKYPAHAGDTPLGIVYEVHPNTGHTIQGYQLPCVKEAIEMVKKAALVVPQVRYVGWDVAVTPNGPIIIEGNTYCAHDFWQLPPHTPDKIGMLPTLKKLVPEYKF